MFSIDRIRSDLEEFTSLVDEEHYLNGAGLKDKAEFTKISEKYGHLFNKEPIDFVREYSKTVEGDEERRVGYLKAFLVGDYMQNKVKELSDRVLTLEVEATVKVEGRTMPFRQAAVVLANESDHYKRGEIFLARNRVMDRLNPVLEERFQLMHETARELGYAGYVELYEDIMGFDLKALEAVLRPLLEKTRALYHERMSRIVMEKTGLGLREAEKHDVSFTFRASQFDGFFPKQNAVP